jgi:pimeloyl-ACP methyl ester carboxylesterase
VAVTWGVTVGALGTTLAVAQPAAAQALQLESCRLPGLSSPARCGTVSRPLDPARPDAGRIELRVAVLPAVARLKRPDPVLFIAGGPGQSAVELAGVASSLFVRLQRRRDVVLVDQRGTGGSRPLECPGDRRGLASRPLAEEFDRDARLAELAACRAAHQAAPATDLRMFTTALAVDDLEAVRQALGVAAWNVVGVSYGTRVGLELMRVHPHSVRRLVLDGVVAPDRSLPRAAAADARRALDAVWQACEADAACRQRHPALRAQWQALLGDLPRRVEVAHPKTGRLESFVLDRDALLGMVRSVLYAPALAAGLPHAVGEAAAGRLGALVGLAAAQDLGTGRGAVASAMHFSVVCSEDLPSGRAAAPAGEATADPGEFGDSLESLYQRVCADWPRGMVPEGFRRVGPAPAAVLALSGGADPVTPPASAERVVQALGPRARHIVVPQAGHGLLALPCLRDAVFRFVEAADDTAALAVEGGCADEVPRPLVFAPPR